MSNQTKAVNEQIEELNDIIAKSYDAEKGYKEAAEEVESSELKNLFLEYAQQRYDFGHQIKDEIRNLGGEIEKGDTIASKVHRAWMDIRSAFSSNDDAAILKEAIRGEKNALSNYEDALEEMPITSSAYKTLVNQRNHIRSVLGRLEQLAPVYSN
ncbi:ferritin-like domain-containing protein [Flavilitoribacter nigricans]|uniref:DUF2383 domain-containing protein n=1 Tax=Flavilitoribacter nigricans (strain ATCC 23147 / DSM 23189 / NBRC 102662 / NCIMB 1420 / SS-2) TaxID=1122177 RepID=A0A2D0N9K7_FLAN2|nr:PA2169 family four-helix-bundle protein [Flavilitoribacter nigricans]PHN05056.1 hypothetical protein CRP01_18705 [Flavilitoribacter nigricans DSM 23189 = NBRC 102662]